jgi:hypothetical protein
MFDEALGVVLRNNPISCDLVIGTSGIIFFNINSFDTVPS